jgi:hypothetical protein
VAAWTIEVDAEYVFQDISDPNVIGRAGFDMNIRHPDPSAQGVPYGSGSRERFGDPARAFTCGVPCGLSSARAIHAGHD